jgi:hypothetical protein
MQFRTFIILGLLVSSVAWGVDRRPAVEDFVGIEIDHPESTPQGTESLVNLEREIQTIHAEAYTVKSHPKKANLESASTISWSLTNTMAVVFIIGLPLISWLFVMNRLRKRASVESASNVEVLERYRKEREQMRKKEEAQRKAS